MICASNNKASQFGICCEWSIMPTITEKNRWWIELIKGTLFGSLMPFCLFFYITPSFRSWKEALEALKLVELKLRFRFQKVFMSTMARGKYIYIYIYKAPDLKTAGFSLALGATSHTKKIVSFLLHLLRATSRVSEGFAWMSRSQGLLQ